MYIMSFINKFEKKLLNQGLNQNTIKSYIQRLRKINDNKDFKSIVFLKKTDKIMDKIKSFKLSDTTFISYLGTITSVLKRYPTKANLESSKKYQWYLDNENDYFKQKVKGVMTDNQQKNWLSKEDFDERVGVAEEKYENALQNGVTTKEQYNDLLNFVVLSLYTLLPPRRNADYSKMVIDSDDDNTNSFDVDAGTFTFRDYKTKKTYGDVVFDLKRFPPFESVLYNYLEHRPVTEHQHLFVYHNGRQFNESNSITRILNKVLNSKMGSTGIRSLYLTNKYSGVSNDIIQDSKDLSHSISTQQHIYVKK